MAYLVHISRVQEDWPGLGWVRYDMAFCRQAAVTGNRQWLALNSSLHAMCFARQKTVSSHCDLCSSTGHSTRQCPQQDSTDPDLTGRVKAIEAVVLSLARTPPTAQPGGPSLEICKLFNNNACKFKRCKYRHACLSCGDAHPAVYCPKSPAQSQASSDVGSTSNGQANRGSIMSERSWPN